MKTSAVSREPNTPASAAAKVDKNPDRKSFSKVLEGRRSKDRSSRKSEMPGEENASRVDDVTVGALPIASLSQTAEAHSEVSSAQAASRKQPIQALVQEISHSLNAQGLEQVDIQLNSKVFDGLKIQIVRQPGNFDIRFESASDVVAQLLARNVGALSQSLAAHGVPVGRIRVNEGEPSRWMSRKAQSRAQDSGRGGNRQT